MNKKQKDEDKTGFFLISQTKQSISSACLCLLLWLGWVNQIHLCEEDKKKSENTHVWMFVCDFYLFRTPFKKCNFQLLTNERLIILF